MPSAGRSGNIQTNNHRREVGPDQAVAVGPSEVVVLSESQSRPRDEEGRVTFPFDLGRLTHEQRELWDRHFADLQPWTEGTICPVSIHELWSFVQIWMLEGGGEPPGFPPDLETELHEDPVTINGRTFRQLAVNGLGRDQATLLLTNQQKLTAKQLIERYGQRWGIENQLAEQIRAFHLDSLCSQVPLAVDFDVALTVFADIVYRRLARGLHAAYHNQTPDTIREYLINGIGELRFTPGHVEVRLRRRTHTPALLDAGYQDRQIEIPWWGGRTLNYAFPAR